MSQVARLTDIGGGCGGSGYISRVSTHFECYGQPAAVHDDDYTCSKHGGQRLIGSSHMEVDGRSIIRVGDRTTCGATILTGAPDSDVL